MYLVGDNTHIYFHFKVDKNFGFGTSQNGMNKKLGGGSTIGYVIEHTSIKD